MKAKTLITFILLTLSVISYGQDDWGTWDKNYRKEKYSDIINEERNYADSVEKDPKIVQYYLRLDKYQIVGEYGGKSRPIDKDVLHSMKNVYKAFVGNPDQLDELVHTEFLFKINGKEIWLPIQKQLEDALKEELKKGQKTTLYCLFLNEHSEEKKLYNTFLISEFRVN